jgi:hypothetical protein
MGLLTVAVAATFVFQDRDLDWKLSPNQAAVYSVYDPSQGRKIEEFWLVGGEFGSGIDMVATGGPGDHRQIWPLFSPPPTCNGQRGIKIDFR